MGNRKTKLKADCSAFAAIIITLAITLGAVNAQTVSRAPVINPHAVPTPTPTPTPPPNPGGVYLGNVTGTVTKNGVPGTFNLGTWTLAVVPLRCGDCDPGQYDIGNVNGGYTGMTYSSGPQERGYIFGVVNPNGRVVGFNLLASNCTALNPSGGLVPNPGIGIAGYYYGGQAGEAPGQTIQFVREDSGFGTSQFLLSGRISGRDCFGQIIIADVRLARQ